MKFEKLYTNVSYSRASELVDREFLEKLHTTVTYQQDISYILVDNLYLENLRVTTSYKQDASIGMINTAMLDKLRVETSYRWSDADTLINANFLNKLLVQVSYAIIGSGEDAYWDEVVLLTRGNLISGLPATDNSAMFVDESQFHHSLVSYSGAIIDGVEYKFGGSSLSFDGINDYVRADAHPDWQLSPTDSSQFTIEVWVNTGSTLGVASQVIGQRQTSSGDGGAWSLMITNIGSIEFDIFNDSGNNYYVVPYSSENSIQEGVWTHIAVDKDELGTLRIYKNGALVLNETPANSSMRLSTQPLTIGNGGTSGTQFGFSGWIDELRITKGVARYASDDGFAVPTSAVPAETTTGLVVRGTGFARGTSTVTSEGENFGTIEATGVATGTGVGVGVSTSEPTEIRRIQCVNIGKTWPLAIYGTPVLSATRNVPYTGFQAQRMGGRPPIIHTLIGSWPTGITVNASTGVVSGTPTVSGTFAGLTVRATDAGATAVDLATFTLTVAP